MNVTGFAIIGNPASTAPKAPTLAFRGGDVCDPLDGNQLDGPPWPSRVLRFTCPLPILPFVSFRWDAFVFFAVLIYATLHAHNHFAWFALALAGAAWIGQKFSRFGFYAGAKLYGFDLSNYRLWKNGEFASEVYPGSQALEFTARFFTDGD